MSVGLVCLFDGLVCLLSVGLVCLLTVGLVSLFDGLVCLYVRTNHPLVAQSLGRPGPAVSEPPDNATVVTVVDGSHVPHLEATFSFS